MGIFKKTTEYVVVTNMTTIGVVREFIAEHSDEGCDVDVHVHGCLLDDNNLVTITFESELEAAEMCSALIDRFFTDYKLAIRRKLIFVFEKEKEEESE